MPNDPVWSDLRELHFGQVSWFDPSGSAHVGLRHPDNLWSALGLDATQQLSVFDTLTIGQAGSHSTAVDQSAAFVSAEEEAADVGVAIVGRPPADDYELLALDALHLKPLWSVRRHSSELSQPSR